MITKQSPQDSSDALVKNDIQAPDACKTPKPLSRCLLFDYRISFRSLLKGRISTTELFERVEEPESLDSCLATIERYPIDTCVFGPSVRANKVDDFLRAVQDSDTKIKCAFVHTRTHARSDSTQGALSIVNFPCSQGAFNAGVVSALASVRGGNLNGATRYDTNSQRHVYLRDSIEKLEYPEGQTVASVIRRSRSSMWPRETFDCVLQNSVILREKLSELQPFNLRFRDDGSPTQFTTETILEVINSVYPNSNNVPGMQRFKMVLEDLLYKWVHMGTELGRKTADTCLRREIINCFSLNMQ